MARGMEVFSQKYENNEYFLVLDGRYAGEGVNICKIMIAR
jgi:hypothetical protein